MNGKTEEKPRKKYNYFPKPSTERIPPPTETLDWSNEWRKKLNLEPVEKKPLKLAFTGKGGLVKSLEAQGKTPVKLISEQFKPTPKPSGTKWGPHISDSKWGRKSSTVEPTVIESKPKSKPKSPPPITIPPVTSNWGNNGWDVTSTVKPTIIESKPKSKPQPQSPPPINLPPVTSNWDNNGWDITTTVKVTPLPPPPPPPPQIQETSAPPPPQINIPPVTSNWGNNGWDDIPLVSAAIVEPNPKSKYKSKSRMKIRTAQDTSNYWNDTWDDATFVPTAIVNPQENHEEEEPHEEEEDYKSARAGQYLYADAFDKPDIYEPDQPVARWSDNGKSVISIGPRPFRKFIDPDTGFLKTYINALGDYTLGGWRYAYNGDILGTDPNWKPEEDPGFMKHQEEVKAREAERKALAKKKEEEKKADQVKQMGRVIGSISQGDHLPDHEDDNYIYNKKNFQIYDKRSKKSLITPEYIPPEPEQSQEVPQQSETPPEPPIEEVYPTTTEQPQDIPPQPETSPEADDINPYEFLEGCLIYPKNTEHPDIYNTDKPVGIYTSTGINWYTGIPFRTVIDTDTGIVKEYYNHDGDYKRDGKLYHYDGTPIGPDPTYKCPRKEYKPVDKTGMLVFPEMTDKPDIYDIDDPTEDIGEYTANGIDYNPNVKFKKFIDPNTGLLKEYYNHDGDYKMGGWYYNYNGEVIGQEGLPLGPLPEPKPPSKPEKEADKTSEEIYRPINQPNI